MNHPEEVKAIMERESLVSALDNLLYAIDANDPLKKGYVINSDAYKSARAAFQAASVSPKEKAIK